MLRDYLPLLLHIGVAIGFAVSGGRVLETTHWAHRSRAPHSKQEAVRPPETRPMPETHSPGNNAAGPPGARSATGLSRHEGETPRGRELFSESPASKKRRYGLPGPTVN